MSPRVLVLRALGLGDFLAGVPALRALRATLPDHELVLAAPEALLPLVEDCRAVDRLVPTGELESVPWTGPPPAVAVDLHGNGPASKALLQELHPGRLVAFAGPGRDGEPVAGPTWSPHEHERARWCRLVSAGFGCGADPDDLLLPAGRPPRGETVVVHPGAASEARRWPVERYAEVARWAAAAGAPVTVTGGPGERALAQRLCELAGLPPGSCRAGETDLAGLAALVASARLVVCGDTGVAHLASAYRTPSVVLFGPTPPARWGPPENGPHDALWFGSGPGNPHADRVDAALLRIPAAAVLQRCALRSGLRPGP